MSEEKDEKVAQEIWKKVLEAKTWVDMNRKGLLEAMHEEWFKAYQTLSRRLRKAEEELKEWRDDQSACMAERCGDEVHCTCVPSLRREVKSLEQENKILTKQVCENGKGVIESQERKIIDLEQRLKEAEKESYECTCTTNPYESLCRYCYVQNALKICKENVELKARLSQAEAENERMRNELKDRDSHYCTQENLMMRHRLSQAEKVLKFADHQLEQKQIRLSHLMDVAKSLADWSRKYPKDTVHSYNNEKSCNDELYAIEEKAKALVAEWDGIKK